MIAALIADERDPRPLAQLAKSSLRRKIATLEEAFVGRFTDHPAFLPTKMLASQHRRDRPGPESLELGDSAERWPASGHGSAPVGREEPSPVGGDKAPPAGDWSGGTRRTSTRAAGMRSCSRASRANARASATVGRF
jgi:hypothetical protein